MSYMDERSLINSQNKKGSSAGKSNNNKLESIIRRLNKQIERDIMEKQKLNWPTGRRAKDGK